MMCDEFTSTFRCPAGASARVSVLNTCLLKAVPTAPYITPIVPGHDKFNDLPTFVFLIENAEGRKALFDLGLRKDWQRLSPNALFEIEHDHIEINIEEDILDVLQKEDIGANDIEFVALSHHHFDHIGDPSLFGEKTKIIVGPGFLSEFLPGYPRDPKSMILESDLKDKDVQEVDFSSASTVKIGSFVGMDVFGDGSFYVVDAPGHTKGHICGLVRTTTGPDTFVLLGADACHHNGEFRPSCHMELPSSNTEPSISCLRHHQRLNMESIQRHLESCGRTTTTSFFETNDDPQYAEYTYDVVATKETVVKVQELDQYDNVLVIMAHDDALLPVLDQFPRTINDWKEKGWGTQSRWAFLLDFKSLLDNETE